MNESFVIDLPGLIDIRILQTAIHLLTPENKSCGYDSPAYLDHFINFFVCQACVADVCMVETRSQAKHEKNNNQQHKLVMMCRNSATETKPLFSLSKVCKAEKVKRTCARNTQRASDETLNAVTHDAGDSACATFRAMIAKNSGNSICLLPVRSTSATRLETSIWRQRSVAGSRKQSCKAEEAVASHLSWLQSKYSHDCAQLASRDAAVKVLSARND